MAANDSSSVPVVVVVMPGIGTVEPVVPSTVDAVTSCGVVVSTPDTARMRPRLMTFGVVTLTLPVSDPVHTLSATSSDGVSVDPVRPNRATCVHPAGSVGGVAFDDD